MITDHDQHCDEQDDPQCCPHQLGGGVRAHRVGDLVDAGDHGETQPVEQENTGQDHGISPRCEEAHEQMCHDRHAVPEPRNKCEVRGQCVVEREMRHDPAAEPERTGQQDQRQLDVAALEVDHHFAGGSGLRRDRHQQASGSDSSVAVGVIGAR